MAGELDGPRLEPPGGQPAKRLVVFLHGYGADGNDLIDIGRAWQGLLPDTAFVSPHAPDPCGQAPVGRQWFPLFTRAPNERWEGVNKAGPVLEHFVEAELARRKLPPSALAWSASARAP
jgi:phospholipase/carboxylesterase